ncbi:MAG: hypothetical protein ACPLSM_05080 [Thermosphaera sp.]
MIKEVDIKLILNDQEREKLHQFKNRIKEATRKLRERKIKPIAIIAISIPDGKLSPYYDEEIVSGKSYEISISYHYSDGVFKLLSKNNEKKSRVVFLDFNRKYLPDLRQYFSHIYVFETVQKKL